MGPVKHLKKINKTSVLLYKEDKPELLGAELIKKFQRLQRLAEKGMPEHLLHREERRQEKLNRPAVKMTKPHRKKKKKQVFEPLVEQNDDFFFIAGYTSGGAPYGVTWEEMGLEPWEELI